MKTIHPNPARLRRPFLELFLRENPREWTPALMFVGAHQETGKRIITGHIESPASSDMLDFYELSKSNIRSSTAVMNSSRFPIISPPGLIRQKTADTKELFYGHIIDGGYFEDGGIETTKDIYLGVVKAFNTMEASKHKKLKPIFIEINSTDTSPPEDLARFHCPEDGKCSERELETRKPIMHEQYPLNEFWGPAQGLLGTRTGRSIVSAKRLSATANSEFNPHHDKANMPEYFTFNLCKGLPVQGKDPSTTTSWALSTVSKADTDTIFLHDPLNLPVMHKVTVLHDRALRTDKCSKKNQKTRDEILEILSMKQTVSK